MKTYKRGEVQPAILAQLEVATNPLSPSDLATALDTNTSSINSAARQLVAKRLIAAETKGMNVFYSKLNEAIPSPKPIQKLVGRIVRISHKNMQPKGEKPRQLEYYGGCSSLALLD